MRALRRLCTVCGRAKHTSRLSAQPNLDIDSLYEGVDFYTSITQGLFQELNADLFRGSLDSVGKTLRDPEVDKNQVHGVVLVGGSTSIAKVHELLRGLFSGEELNESINLDDMVAYDAAVQAAVLGAGKSEEVMGMLLLDVMPLCLGLETVSRMMEALTKRNAAMLTKRTARGGRSGAHNGGEDAQRLDQTRRQATLVLRRGWE